MAAVKGRAWATRSAHAGGRLPTRPLTVALETFDGMNSATMHWVTAFLVRVPILLSDFSDQHQEVWP